MKTSRCKECGSRGKLRKYFTTFSESHGLEIQTEDVYLVLCKNYKCKSFFPDVLHFKTKKEAKAYWNKNNRRIK